MYLDPANMTTSPTGITELLSKHQAFSDPTSASSPLPALYSDLSRQRKSNPSGFRASILFWQDLLMNLSFNGSTSSDHTVLRLDETLKSAFTVSSVGRPLGLGTVVSELEKTGSLIEASAFQKGTKKVLGPAGRAGWRGYLPSSASAVITTPVTWAAKQVYSAVIGSDAGDGEYSEDEHLFKVKKGDWVWYELVHRVAQAYLDRHYGQSSSPLDNLMSPSDFSEKLGEVCQNEFGWKPSTRDTALVLKHLTRDCDGAAVSSASLVKLASTPEEQAGPITDEDQSILAVTTTLRTLESQIATLEMQISSRTDQIKAALKANNKPKATSLLRSRKALEDLLVKRLAAKENIESVVLRIEQALGDVEVMKGYNAANEALKGVLGREELKIENVERTKDSLEELMASGREIDEVVRSGGLGAEVDEDEIMRELEGLEEEKRKEDGLRKGEKKQNKQEEEERRKQDTEAEDLMARFERLRVAQQPPSTTPSTAPGEERAEAKQSEAEQATPDAAVI